MKTIKKTIAYILALTCCFSGTAVISAKYTDSTVVARAESAEVKTYGDYSYIIHDSIYGVCDTPCIEITEYANGNDFQIIVPAEIGGLPVVSIAGDVFTGCDDSYIYLPSSIKHFGEGFIDDLSAGRVIIDNKLEFSKNLIRNGTAQGSFSLTYVYPPETDDDEEEIIEDIEIPETVCGLPVTSIEQRAFADNKNIRSVKIPDTVEYFGIRVFANSSLQSVNIPKSLKILPSNTFSGCTELKTVEFHENVIVGNNAFKDTDFRIPDNVLVSENTDLSVATSYSDITKQSGAFNIKISHDSQNGYFCEVMSYNPDFASGTAVDVVIPDYFYEIPVKAVNKRFWEECDNAGTDLNSIVFPSEINEIYGLSLNNPEKLQSVTIKGKNIEISDNTFRNTGIKEITLNGSCNIGAMTFMNCKELKKVTFTGNDSVITLGHDAFSNCTSLEEVIFPENMTADFAVDSFGYCPSVKTLTLKGNINANSHSFRECDNLENLILKGNITLDTNAFSGCENLANIEIDTDKPINGSAFNGCTSLMNINSSPVYNTAEKSFSKEISDFIFSNFNGADDVGFINLYVTGQVEKVVSQYITDDMTDMQKIKTLHDWVCNNVVYDDGDMSTPKNHNDASIFMNDSTVCEGYAKCYNLLLNKAGIETYYLIGDNHAWNVVKLGGHYFHSDTTWDDGDTINYDWFLKSDSEALAETDSHSVWNFRTPSTLHSFQKETLPECKYSMGDINTDGKTNVADLVMLNRYITGQDSVNADDIVLADLTYDGVTDVFDLVLMRKLILNK